MRKLLMVLFLFGTISVFCNAQIDGYYVKDSGNLALFADGEPRTSNSIGIEAGQKMSGSDYIQFNPGGSGRFALIWTQSASKGDSAVFCVTDKNGDVLTITIHAY